MYCINCGNEMSKDIKFCSGCGNENKSSENYVNEDKEKVNKAEEYEYLYREPLITSIIKGLTFIPNCAGSVLGTVGYRRYGYAMAWIFCIILAPTWIIISIVVILYRIFIMPKLKGNNII